MSNRKHSKFIREGPYVAEVDVKLMDSPDAWAPHLSLEEARKLDEVRLALRRGDVKSAAKLGRIYRLTPITS